MEKEKIMSQGIPEITIYKVIQELKSVATGKAIFLLKNLNKINGSQMVY